MMKQKYVFPVKMNKRIILGLSMFFLFLALLSSVDANKLLDDLLYYYDLNDTTDVHSGKNFTEYNSVAYNVGHGKLGSGLDCDSSNEGLQHNYDLPNNNGTINLWYKYDTWGSKTYSNIFSRVDTSSSQANPIELRYKNLGTDDIEFYMGDGSSKVVQDTHAQNVDTTFRMFTVSFSADKDKYIVWRDGTVIMNITDNTDAWADDSNDKFTLCSWGYSSDRTVVSLDGGIDELGIWNRTLNQSDIDNLYNSGSALSYNSFTSSGGGGGSPPGNAPSITLNTNLTSNTNHTENPLTFSIDAIGNVVNTTDTWNITVYIDNVLNQTHLDISNLNTTKFIINLTYGDEETAKDINVTVNHGYDQANDSFQRTNIFIDSILPNINMLSTYKNTTEITNNSIFYHDYYRLKNFTIQCHDPNLLSCNVTIFKLNNTDGSRLSVMNNTINTSITVPKYNISMYFDLKEFTNGRYEIFGESWDDHTKKEIKPYKNKKLVDGYDFDEKIKITSPQLKNMKVNKKKDRYSFEMEFDQANPEIYIESNGKLKYRPNSRYKGHIVDFENKKWIDFEDETLGEVDVIKVNDNKFKIVPKDKNKKNFKFNSIGDLNRGADSWYFNVTDGFTFTANDTISGVSITNFTILVYNNSNIIRNESTTDGNLTLDIIDGTYLTNISASGYTNNNTQITYSKAGSFNWELFASNSLYLFFYDEKDKSLINDQNVTVTLINLANTSSEHTTDTGSVFISGFATGTYTIEYDAPTYRKNQYFTTITTGSTQQLDLYMVSNNSGSLVVFNLADERGNPVFNATLKRQRFVLSENAYITVGMSKTDNNGDTGQYLVPNDVFYIFVVDKNDVTLYTSDKQQIYSSQVYLRVPILEDILESLGAIRDSVTTSLVWDNSTNLVTYTWNDASNLVNEGCLEVTRSTLLDEKTYLSCANSVSATVEINLTGELKEDTSFMARGYLETNTTSSTYYTDIISFIVTKDYERFGKLGLFVSYIFIGTMFLLGIAFSFSVALVYSMLALIGIQVIGVGYFGYGFIAFVTIIGFIIAVVNKI